jgi:hypothetical protein
MQTSTREPTDVVDVMCDGSCEKVRWPIELDILPNDLQELLQLLVPATDFLLEALDGLYIHESNGNFQRGLALQIMNTGKPIDDFTIREMRELIAAYREHYKNHHKKNGRLYFYAGEELIPEANLPQSLKTTTQRPI